MQNKNKINQTMNQITNHQHWGLGVLAGLAVIAIAGSALAFNFNQTQAQTVAVGGVWITAPTDGESWITGQMNDITWDNTTNEGFKRLSPRLEYRVNSDPTGRAHPLTSSVIVDSGFIDDDEANSGKFSWKVGYTRQDDGSWKYTNIAGMLGSGANAKSLSEVMFQVYAIAHTDSGLEVASQLSPGWFEIKEQPITLTAPQGGGDWKVGDIQVISWNMANDIDISSVGVGIHLCYRNKTSLEENNNCLEVSEFDIAINPNTGQPDLFDWKVGYKRGDTDQTVDGWFPISLPSGTYWADYEYSIEATLWDYGNTNEWLSAPKDVSGWFNIEESPITFIIPDGSETWELGSIQTLEWKLREGIPLPANIDLHLHGLESYNFIVKFLNVEETFGSFDWKVGYKQSGSSWELISLPDRNPEASWNDFEFAIYGYVASEAGERGESKQFNIIDVEQQDTLPLSGVYYSANIELTQSIDAFTSSSVAAGFEEGFGQIPNARVEVGIAFIDEFGDYITLKEEGGTDYSGPMGLRNGNPYYFFYFFTEEGFPPYIEDLNIANNLSTAKYVQFIVEMDTPDWNIAQPYFESLSITYDTVTSADLFTITVTPMNMTAAPGDSISYNIEVVDNDPDDDMNLGAIKLTADLSAFDTDVEYKYEYGFVPLPGGPPGNWSLLLQIASVNLQHLNEEFTISGTIDGVVVVTSDPVGLFITDRESITVNFTASIQIPFGSTPKDDPSFWFYVYENDADEVFTYLWQSTAINDVIVTGHIGNVYTGSFSVPTYLEDSQVGVKPDYTYTVFAKTPQHLSRRATENINMPATLVGDETFDIEFSELLAGDIGGTNEIMGNDRDDNINAIDFTQFSGEFDNLLLDMFADFNNDGDVNAMDVWPFSTSNENFMLWGDLAETLGWDTP